MKITPNTYRLTLPERPQQNQAPTNTKPGNQTTGSSAVALSSAARHLQQAQATTKDINTDLVETLRSAIANGTMTIDTNRIVDNLLASTRELLK